MAQAIATLAERRHGFAYLGSYSLDFGRISALAVTQSGNLLICDNMKQNVVLVNHAGRYIHHLPVEGNPWDIAVSERNEAIVTVPNKQCVLFIDPDRLIIFRNIFPNTQPMCISTVSGAENLGRGTVNLRLGIVDQMKNLTFTKFADTSLLDTSYHQHFMSSHRYSAFLKLHCIVTKQSISDYLCIAGHRDLTIKTFLRNNNTLSEEHETTFEGMLDVPSDICEDDNRHIYVCGQHSHNILRLTQDGKLVDIPLSHNHGIEYPVALCFNQFHNKLYIANNFGKSIITFNVV